MNSSLSSTNQFNHFWTMTIGIMKSNWTCWISLVEEKKEFIEGEEKNKDTEEDKYFLSFSIHAFNVI
jgi:hypothetical protein